MAELDSAKYISFVSFKRVGSRVATPTWVTPYGDGYAFTTDPASFKVKRVRNNPSMEVSTCTIRGTVNPDAAVYVGTARVLDPEQSQEVERLIKAKYRVSWTLFIIPLRFWDRLRGKDRSAGDAGIAFTLQP